MPYDPKPVDTSWVRLTSDLKKITERLAENTHDIWASQRMHEGWRYGPQRNDQRRETPNLVRYDELSEVEKEYDRRTAMETIRVLLAMGYSVISPAGAQAAVTNAESAIELEMARCRAALNREPSLATVAALWADRNLDLWSDSPELHVLLGEVALRLGEPLIAFDLLKEGLSYHPAHVRLRQLEALALARSGAASEAKTILTKLVEEGRSDEETLGILARTHKDLGLARPDAGTKTDLLDSFRLYREVWDRTGGFYSGINAATLAVTMGEPEQAKAIAQKVREKILARPEDSDYWATATLAEAALILGHWQEAQDRYTSAVGLAGRDFGDVHSTRRNARLLLDHLQPAPSAAQRDAIEQCFRIPDIVLFTGHMIDQPGREHPRFPPEREPSVRDQLRERLKAMKPGFGYTSVACGSDILFAETMLELGNEVQIVLPYEQEKFIRDSVDILPGGNWKKRCEEVLRKAAGVTVASDRLLTPGGVEYEYANLYLFGLALARSHQLDTPLRTLAVWDGNPGDGSGGTASAISRWQEYGLPVEVVPVGDREISAPPKTFTTSDDPEIRGLLFGDAVGFSKLTAEEVPLFVKHFLGLIGELADEHPPLLSNTWGDGLYLVFRTVREAGVFALNVCGRVAETNWRGKGLRDLNLRIGVHAGPVYACVDPVSKRQNYIGSHVSRAARIEPITPPGRVYASQAFAAIAAVDQVTEFTCDYVGRIGMAKGYGTFPTYVVRR